MCIIDAKDTCEFHTPQDWTYDTKEYLDTDDGNTGESNEENSFDNQLRANAEDNVGPEINGGNVYDQERDIHTLNRGRPIKQMENYERQLLNKAWRQPYGTGDQDMYQPNHFQKVKGRGDAEHEHEDMAQALAKQKGI